MKIELEIQKPNSKTLLICVLIVCLGVLAGWIRSSVNWNNWFSQDETRTQIVTITPEGFKPNEIEVGLGSIVRFINSDSKPRWPASDPHPTHDIYPELDPKTELVPGQTWEIRMSKTGIWTYHDHLSPHQKGKIIVNRKFERERESGDQSNTPAKNTLLVPDEIRTISNITDTKKQAEMVKQTAEKYGPMQTLAFMKMSGLPYTGETHLLVHEIGNVAYAKYKDEALKYCDDSYLSACYHGVIINSLADNGMLGVATMIEKCIPSGPLVTSQCSHAAGHGFLAWVDYKVTEALKMCDDLVKTNNSLPAFNCYDGVFMENIFGVHDGKPSPNRMVKQDDMHYPCNVTEEKYQGGCWANQATLMYQLSGGDYKAMAKGCDDVKNPEFQATCYHNFARQIHPVTMGQAPKAVELCRNATSQKWIDQCLITLVEAAFSVGDKKDMPFKLCQYVKLEEKFSECNQVLINRIKLYSSGADDQRKMCALVENEQWKQKCVKQ